MRDSPKRSARLAGTHPFDAAPAVCRAGEFQFAPGQTHRNACVQSRALFWCRSGRGTFRVNGREYSLEPHDLYVLPWNRRIEYHASEREPMFTAHVHVVPWIRPGAAWVPNVPHDRSEPLFDSPDRADVAWDGCGDVVRLHIDAEGPLGRLINYVTHWFRESPRSEAEGRALGVLVVHELQRRLRRSAPTSERRPEELSRLLLHIDLCFKAAPTVEQLAGILGRSRSHVLRLFQRHLRMSAKAYILGRQIREARELLLSTTLSIGEIGCLAGVPDPYHFSKLFRRMVGMSPSHFRRLGEPLPVGGRPSVHSPVPPPPEPDDAR
jgi:AraC-like DNA-binding protein/quercetin dioxygenase-like cupin family protein